MCTGGPHNRLGGDPRLYHMISLFQVKKKW